jgi:hypothetical protein
LTQIHQVLNVKPELADLGVIKSHSRPHVSNDNPFSKVTSKP